MLLERAASGAHRSSERLQLEMADCSLKLQPDELVVLPSYDDETRGIRALCPLSTVTAKCD
jgi:hypothetical protein